MMTTQGAPMSDASTATPDTGDFPFPLSTGTDESKYLVWLRNHSNYMAVRGFLDYFRSAGALLRGIVINFLIFLPALLVASVVLAYSHHWMLRHPFEVTLWALAFASAYVLWSPISVQLGRLRNYKKSLRTGSVSSVKKRDRYERLFGALLFLILSVAILESVPWILEFFNDRLRRGVISWQGELATLGSALTLLSASAKLLSVERGAKRTLAMGLIGVLGLLVPLSVILFVSNYLLYGYPPSPVAIAIPIIAAILIVIGIISAIAIGVSGRTLKRKELAFAFGLLIVGVVLGIQGVPTVATKASKAGENASATLDDTLATPIDGLVSALNEIDRPENLDPELTELLDEIATRHSEWNIARAEIPKLPDDVNATVDPPDFWQFVKTKLSSKDSENLSSKDSENLSPYYNWENIKKFWHTNHILWKRNSQIFHSRERQLIPLADALLSQPKGSLALLRPEIVKVARKKVASSRDLTDDQVAKQVFEKYAGLEADAAGAPKEQLTKITLPSKAMFILLSAFVILLGCWIAVDVNVTSIHALYRDRLASAFLVGRNTKGGVDIEDDIDLHHICRYEAGSTAPYHLINVALNLQGSKDIGIRDRNSDFFIFSKRFIGGDRTGYCRSELMEQVFPQMSLGSAMAVSAAAASPNMGRGTSPLLVAFMTLLNIRLGFWMPNPGLLQESARNGGRRRRQFPQGETPPGFDFANVFAEELEEIENRWRRVYPNAPQCRSRQPTVKHGLVGIAFSGGGIRSAAINLGITQALHDRGVFHHVDYMSTVSGGGYLGSSISALMRYREGDVDKPLLNTKRTLADERKTAAHIEPATAIQWAQDDESEENRFDSIGDRFRWQVRPVALLREMLSRLDERHCWVNLSDGGHIENLATIELLHRRCKYIIIGDGEADPNLHFAGLATLMRSARLDLQIKIEIDLDAIRLRKNGKSDNEAGISGSHWTVGKITYPTTNGKAEIGYLLYLKSSFTGDEDETIREYRHRNPTFPHQTTADQFFDEGQFEAYRALGQHIAEMALDCKHVIEPLGGDKDEKVDDPMTKMSHEDLASWFKELWEKRMPAQPAKPV
jgi:hypothetical protein